MSTLAEQLVDTKRALECRINQIERWRTSLRYDRTNLHTRWTPTAYEATRQLLAKLFFKRDVRPVKYDEVPYEVVEEFRSFLTDRVTQLQAELDVVNERLDSLARTGHYGEEVTINGRHQ